MNSDLNLVILEGKIAGELKLRQTKEGVSVTTVEVKTTSKHKRGSTTSYIDCIFYGQYADFICQEKLLGKHIVLNGRLEQSKFTDKNGNIKDKAQVVVTFFKVLGHEESFNPDNSSLSFLDKIKGVKNV